MPSARPHGGNLMKIRRAEATDEDALARIRRSAILALAVPAMSMEQAEKWASRAAADRIARAIREHDVWVAVEETAIGWAEVDGDLVAALYVSPSCSGQGVGSALLARAETSIRSSGHATARLESSQNALAFYVRRGYLRCGPPEANGACPLSKDLAAVGPNQGMEPTPPEASGSCGALGGQANAGVTERPVPQTTIRAYAAAWAARDRGAWLRTFAADATQEDPVGDPVRRGQREIGEFWDREMARYGSIEILPREIFVIGHEAAMVWTINGVTDDGAVSFDGVDVFQFDDSGRIRSVRAF